MSFGNIAGVPKRTQQLTGGLAKTLFLVLLPMFAATTAQADGFRNPFQNAAALAQGNAFVAQADDASAVFYNPAAMTQLRGIQHVGGFQLVNVRTRFRALDGRTAENDLGGPFGFPPPLQMFLTAAPADLGASRLDGLSLGFGLQNLYGFGARYPADSPLNTAVIKAKLPLLDIKPTLAYRLNDWLSLGGGIDVFTFWPGVVGAAEQEFVSPGLPGIPAGSRVRITGTGTTVGGNAAVFITPVRTEEGQPRMNLGFVWRSEVDLPLRGHLYVNRVKTARAESELHFPDTYTAALAVWPVRDGQREWKVETNVDYVRWSTIKDLEFRFSNDIAFNAPQSWRNSVSVGTGTEYKWKSLESLPSWDLAVRAGYLWSPTPVRDRSFNPAFPDSNSHVLSGGVGFTCKPGGKFLGLFSCGDPDTASPWRHTGVDLSYQMILWETRRVLKNLNPAINGTYRSRTQAVGVSFRTGF